MGGVVLYCFRRRSSVPNSEEPSADTQTSGPPLLHDSYWATAIVVPTTAHLTTEERLTASRWYHSVRTKLLAVQSEVENLHFHLKNMDVVSTQFVMEQFDTLDKNDRSNENDLKKCMDAIEHTLYFGIADSIDSLKKEMERLK